MHIRLVLGAWFRLRYGWCVIILCTMAKRRGRKSRTRGVTRAGCLTARTKRARVLCTPLSSLPRPTSQPSTPPTSCRPPHPSVASATNTEQQTKDKNYHEAIRSAISAIYKSEFYERPDIPLTGRGGVVSSICNIITTAHPSVVLKVVRKCKEALDSGGQYQAKATYKRPQERKISPGSFEEHLVSVYRQRHSVPTTASLINSMKAIDKGGQYDEAKDYVSETAVKTALAHMKHEKQKVKKVPQQSNNNPVWVRARYNLTAQLLVRFGLELPSHVTEEGEIDPAIIDKVQLAAKGHTLSIYQIAWWDEIHIRQKIGELLEYIYVFAQDENGLYNKKSTVQRRKLVSTKQKQIYNNHTKNTNHSPKPHPTLTPTKRKT